MYIAYGSVEDDYHHGSTKLHIDMTDAVNIMVWASSETGYALWRIFPQAASSIVCNFLQTHAGLSGPLHPIHSQRFYFTPHMLAELERQHGIRPYTIRQHSGEAIYIPAGCAHQVRYPSCIHSLSDVLYWKVSNQTDAIKIACDFLSIENLAETQRICSELREHRLATKSGDDVLQFFTTLWHAWKWLVQQPDVHDAPDLSPAGFTIGYHEDSIDDIHADHALEAVALLHKREKQRARKKARLLVGRQHRPGCDFGCPICPRMFHRAGLLDHL